MLDPRSSINSSEAAANTPSPDWSVQVTADVAPPERMSPGPRVLRVFFDHGHRWPLWETGTHKLAMEPSDYGFSDELTDLLARWFKSWEPIADFDIGQPVPTPSQQDREMESELAKEAVAVIRREVPADVEIDVSLTGL